MDVRSPLSLIQRGGVIYMKIIKGGVPHHLCVMDPISYEAKTLCGVILTEHQSWKRIRALEGDECPQCAERAFNGQGQRVPDDLKQSG